MVDGGLHIRRGGVHTLAQVELKSERRTALRTLRGHERQPRDLHELTFQRRGHIAGHRRRARAGVIYADCEHREIDCRQIVYGQLLKANDPENDDAQREHHRHDGTLDKGIG